MVDAGPGKSFVGCDLRNSYRLLGGEGDRWGSLLITSPMDPFPAQTLQVDDVSEEKMPAPTSLSGSRDESGGPRLPKAPPG